jgi:hypothetical protein
LECVRLLLFEKKKQRKRGEQKQGQEEEGGEEDEEEEKETEEEWAKTKGKDKSKKRDTLISLTRQQEKRERFVVNQRKQLLSAKNHRGRTPQNIADMVGVHEVVLGGGLGSTLRMGKGSVLTERIGLGLGPATSTTRVRPTSAVIRARNSGMLDILQPSQRKVTSKRTGERREGGGGGGGGSAKGRTSPSRSVAPSESSSLPSDSASAEGWAVVSARGGADSSRHSLPSELARTVGSKEQFAYCNLLTCAVAASSDTPVATRCRRNCARRCSSPKKSGPKSSEQRP